MPGRVVGVGCATVDLIGVVPRWPDLDAKVELAQFSIQGGGPTATALATLATFGVQTAFVGKVADDWLGQFILRGLRSLGVDVSRVAVEEGRLSPVSFIAVDRKSGRRTVFHTRGDVSPLEARALDLSVLDGAAALMVDGHHPAAQVAACERARERGVRVVLDGGSVRGGMGELVALCDVLIASERFASELAPRGEVEDSLEELRAMGPGTVVITLGDQGAVGLGGTRPVRVPALEVQAVDTTGAGDVYHGAFAYGLLADWPLERCMRFAGAAAGLKCRSLGGRGGIPSLEETLEAAGAPTP